MSYKSLSEHIQPLITLLNKHSKSANKTGETHETRTFMYSRGIKQYRNVYCSAILYYTTPHYFYLKTKPNHKYTEMSLGIHMWSLQAAQSTSTL